MKQLDTASFKTFFALLCCAILSSAPLFAQTWTQQSVSGSFYGVSFVDSTIGYAVGAGGGVFKTTNRGTTWVMQTSGTSTMLRAVSFSDANHGTAVGLSGTIIRTTDGGATWASQTSGTSSHLFGVSFTDTNNGTAVGSFGTRLRTTNGGSTWVSQGSLANDLYSVSFTDSAHGTAVGFNGGIFRTTNAGTTWTTQTAAIIHHYSGVHFSDSSHGTAVADDGTIIRTTNGGANWTIQTSGISTPLQSVSFADSNNGIAVGLYGMILRTTNGGTYWAASQVGSGTNFYGVAHTNPGVATAVGLSFGSGTVYRSSNATAMPPATVVTNAATAVDMVTTNLSGTVNAKGTSTVVRFLRGTVSGIYTDSVLAAESPLTGSTTLANANVSTALTGLTPNTTYYVRAAAENSISYVRGSEVTFKTLSSLAPTVATLAPSGVQFDAASLNGTVNTHGASTVVRFLRGTASGVYMDSVTASQSPMIDSTSTTASYAMTGLDTGTTYYVRIAASNSLYYARGSEVSFTTKPVLPPTVAVTAPTAMGATIATLNGTLNTHGVTTTVRFLRGTVSGTYTDSVDAAQNPVTDSTANTLSAAVTGLAANTTYYVKIAAANAHYYVRSVESSITTPAVTTPGITTLAASSVSSTAATMNGIVLPYGSNTVVRFLRGTASGVYTDSITASQTPVNNVSTNSVSGTFSGLSPNTTYYVRAIAYNGTQYARGSEVSFTTYSGTSSLNAVSFTPSNNFIDVPYDGALNPATNFTVEFWARPQGGDWEYRCALGTEDGTAWTGYYFYASDGNTWQCWVGDGTNWNIIQGPFVSNGVWDHLALTYSTDEMKFYVNGVLYGTVPLVFAPNASMPLRIGALAEDGSVLPWYGDVDEVRLWNVVRTEQQIRENLHRNLTGSTTNMIAYFPLNEGTGTTTGSIVGGYTGTFSGSPEWITSSIPLGTASSSSTSAFTTGTATFGSIALTTTDDMDNAVDLTGTVLTSAPNAIPTGSSSIVGNKYFIIEPYGDPGTFSTDLSFTFGAGILPSPVDVYPAAVKLYQRSSNSTGDWTLVGAASSANSGTGTVTWTGITSFGQFAAVVSATPAVAASAATVTGPQSALLNGSVNAHGFSTTVHFLYGTTSGVYTDSITVPQSPMTGTDAAAVSAGFYDLSVNSTYYVKVSALNSYSYVLSSEISFTTAQPESAGFALTFDGVDDYITIPDTSTLDITASITLEAWVKFNTIGHNWIIGKDPYNTAYQLFADTYSGNEFIFQINSDAQAKGGTPAVGVWTHVAGTYDGANLKLYVNGELVATTPYSTPITATSGPLKIGAFDYLGTPWYPMNGSIEEVRIWNTARTQKEIRENMHRSLTSAVNLTAYFKLNEGAGTLTTGTFNAYSGTLMNSPSWSASTAPLGTGSSISTSGSISTGTVSLGAVTVTTTEDFDSPVAFTATTVRTGPNMSPSGYANVIGSKYFIVTPFGTPGTFSANLTINYGPGVLDSRAETFPEGVRLYKRSSNGHGTWTLVGSAASANVTTGVVTFTGLTSFSQFAAVYEESALPVELVSFTAVSDRMTAKLTWSTATEVNNHGFEVERKIVSGFKSQVSGENTSNLKHETSIDQWIRVAFVKGNGSSNDKHEYSYTDRSLSAGTYAFRLKQIDRDGTVGYSKSVEITVGSVPKIFALEQNYPNPFNPSTTIGFTLKETGPVSLKIYDAIGREVAELVNEVLEAGVYHQRQFNGSQFASGIYFSRLESGGKSQVKKIMLVK